MRRLTCVALLLATALAVLGTPVPASAAPAAPCPSAPAVPAGVPACATKVFSGDWETGNASQWQTCQNKLLNGPCSGWNPSYPLTFVGGGQQRQGTTAARFEVRDGDVPSFGGGERSEVDSRRPGATLAEGQEKFYTFSLKFDSGFTCPTGSYFIVLQFHPPSNQPPRLALMVNSACELVLADNVTNTGSRVIGDIARGSWADYTLHVKGSANAAAGFVEVWRNGVVTVPRQSWASLGGASAYLKMGAYRTAAESGTAVVWHDGLAVYTP
jgi:hypothetical protein